MSVDRIITVIRSSQLSDDVKDRAVEDVKGISGYLTKRFDSLKFKPPTAHEEWMREIVDDVMSRIEQTLIDSKVSVPDGRRVYENIYEAITS